MAHRKTGYYLLGEENNVSRNFFPTNNYPFVFIFLSRALSLLADDLERDRSGVFHERFRFQSTPRLIGYLGSTDRPVMLGYLAR